ncbi:hypothetical protein HRbin39_01145 [bacterium HR39]|nr:hypothetical protein HRbin39_01145 [bacterium HR39]
MPTVEITVNGRRHVVQCGEGEEQRLRDLAAYVDARVQDLARRHGGLVGDSRLLVLVALLLADELDDAYAALKARERELEALRAELRALRRRLEEAGSGEDAARLAALAGRLEALAARLDAL